MTKIYHNAHCSKSRQTLALLQQRGIVPEIILYMETPPTATELERIIGQLGCTVTDMVRFKEDLAGEMNLKPDDIRSTKEWCELLVTHPVLIERPIVIHNGKACVGRPPEKVLEIL
jgi:arsenate reductase